jgi:hypothetical protein
MRYEDFAALAGRDECIDHRCPPRRVFYPPSLLQGSSRGKSVYTLACESAKGQSRVGMASCRSQALDRMSPRKAIIL